jgi:hypothetical protein
MNKRTIYKDLANKYKVISEAHDYGMDDDRNQGEDEMRDVLDEEDYFAAEDELSKMGPEDRQAILNYIMGYMRREAKFQKAFIKAVTARKNKQL